MSKNQTLPYKDVLLFDGFTYVLKPSLKLLAL